jgi:methyltransferase (TIGR00027 family)
MQPTEPSNTAKMAALARGLHRLRHDPPWVLDDPFAIPLIGPAWEDLFAAVNPMFPLPVQEAVIGYMTVRSRYAEDRLAAGKFAQYVILGAGLDSFAWRRPDMLKRLTVVEVDHPATQAWKQDRAAAIALPRSERHVFAAIDFETDTLRDGLDAVAFDWSVPTLFAWIGVAQYLTAEAIEATLRTIGDAGQGSEIVVSYLATRPSLNEIDATYLQVVTALASQSGEPLLTAWTPEEAAAAITGCGLEVVDHPDHEALADRYFARRADGVLPASIEGLITARVVG